MMFVTVKEMFAKDKKPSFGFLDANILRAHRLMEILQRVRVPHWSQVTRATLWRVMKMGIHLI